MKGAHPNAEGKKGRQTDRQTDRQGGKDFTPIVEPTSSSGGTNERTNGLTIRATATQHVAVAVPTMNE